MTSSARPIVLNVILVVAKPMEISFHGGEYDSSLHDYRVCTSSCSAYHDVDDEYRSPLGFSTTTNQGIDYKVRFATIRSTKVKMQIWDTAGQERFRTITEQYYRSTQGILLVYDQTNPDSLESVRHWMQQIRAHACEAVQVVLVGNKKDRQAVAGAGVARGRELAAE